MRLGKLAGGLLIGGIWAILSGGCASVEISMPGMSKGSDKPAEASERVALIEAANALAAQPWGQLKEDGLSAMIFGSVAETKRDRALKAYVSAVQAGDGRPVDAVDADVEDFLNNAQRVVVLGKAAFTSIAPVSSDISALETAISETRESRMMFERAYEALEDDGFTVGKPRRREARARFNEALTELGETADMVAERVRSEIPPARFAQPGPGHFDGSQ